MGKLIATFLFVGIAVFVVHGQQQNATEVTESPISASNSSVSEGQTKRTCACDDSESMVCASNGVTYKNSCRFNCAKARVNRLRIVRQGQCSQTAGTLNYWKKG